MQVVKVKYNGKVFVPLERIEMDEIKSAVVVIEGERKRKPEGFIEYSSEEYKNWKPLPKEERMRKAYEEYKSKFNDEPDTELLELVGIAPPLTPDDQKRELKDILEERYIERSKA